MTFGVVQQVLLDRKKTTFHVLLKNKNNKNPNSFLILFDLCELRRETSIFSQKDRVQNRFFLAI